MKRNSGLIKACVLIVFIVSAGIAVHLTPVKGFLTPEKLGRFLHGAGVWAPAAYIMVYTAGVCLFVPGTLLTALGAAISARIGALFTSGLVR